MLLIDDSTRFRVAIPMRSREEGSAKIRNFVSRFNALAGASGGRIARVGSLLSDGAKELVSNEMQEYTLKTSARTRRRALRGSTR